jgi:hypothetical protein
MTFQSPQQNWQPPQDFIQQIMQLAMGNKMRPQNQNDGSQGGIPQQGMPQGQQGGNPQQSPGSGSNSIDQLQGISQLMGYQPNTTFGYNMSNSQSPNAPSQNFGQSGGAMGWLMSLFGGGK